MSKLAVVYTAQGPKFITFVSISRNMDRGDDFRDLVQQGMICVLIDQILED